MSENHEKQNHQNRRWQFIAVDAVTMGANFAAWKIVRHAKNSVGGWAGFIAATVALSTVREFWKDRIRHEGHSKVEKEDKAFESYLWGQSRD
jgi:hypothetical protein